MTKNNFLDNMPLIALLYKWRKKIITISFTAAVCAAIISLFIPNTYKSGAIIFPTINLSSGKALLHEKDDFLDFGKEADLEHMIQILESDEIRKRVIEKFDLLNHYNLDSTKQFFRVELHKMFAKATSFKVTALSSISISVLDRDPQMAANIANEIVSLIDTVINNMHKKITKQGYEILKKDRNYYLDELTILEDSLDKIRKLGVLHYEPQIERLYEQLGLAYVKNNMLAVKYIEEKLEIVSKYGGQFVSLRDQIYYVRGNLNHINQKINEHKLTAEDQLEHKFVLNYAIPADKKSYPIRWLIVLTTACATVLMMIVLIVLKEKLKQLKQS